MFKDNIRDLKNEFKGYNMQTLLQDILAGLTVAAVALPLALAFGVSSGADAGAGLITAIIGVTDLPTPPFKLMMAILLMLRIVILLVAYLLVFIFSAAIW